MRRTTLAIAALVALLVAGAFRLRDGRNDRPPQSARAPVRQPKPPEPPPEPEAIPPQVLPALPAGPPPPPRPPGPVQEESAPGPKGGVLGRVKILGAPPPRRTIRLPDGTTTLAEDAIVDRTGHLMGAFVYVKSGLDTFRLAPTRVPVFLDIVGHRFDPHVLGLRVGQELRIAAFDREGHLPRLPFEERGCAAQGDSQRWTATVTRPEIMVKVACVIHSWEGAWVGVLDHPFFAVTDGSGVYGLPPMPAGRYTIGVWHERYASVAQTVDVPPGDPVEVDFFLDARK